MAMTRLNYIRFVRESGHCYVLKRRRPYSGPLITIGNLYAKYSKLPILVLPTPVWHIWESRVYENAYHQNSRVTHDGWLRMRQAPGQMLSTILSSAGASQQTKMRAVKLAVSELTRLHSLSFSTVHAVTQPFSHGDATCHNVSCSLETPTATWYDFDSIHTPGLTANQRHADDLRALIISSTACLANEAVELMTKTVVQTYKNPEPLSHLRERFLDPSRSENTLHLAQANLDFSRIEIVHKEILAAM